MSADPTRVVPDADVLVADLLVGGAAREAVDLLVRHDWLTLVASDVLLQDAECVIAELGEEGLATDWRATVEEECEVVDGSEGDHPGLATAYRGEAAHLLSLDEGLTSAQAGISLKPRVDLSVRTPDAFVSVFEPEALYEATQDGEYPGPDRPPRA